MRKMNLSLVTILAMSTFAAAGGDITPVEPVVVQPEAVEQMIPAANNGFYIGGAYGYETLKIDGVPNGNSLVNANFGSIMLDAGYKFNPYVAVEGRYWFGISSSNTLAWRNDINSDITVDSWGLFVKPMYPVSDVFDVYALLGYGSADATYKLPKSAGTITSKSVTGFSWGLGAEYSFTDDWAVFVDYTSVLNKEPAVLDSIKSENTLSGVNVGVNYKF